MSITIQSQVLGAALVDPKHLETVLIQCTTADFTGIRSAAFTAMQRLREEGQTPDLITVTNRVGDNHAATIAGWTTTATAGTLEPKIAELRRESQKRRIKNLAATIAEYEGIEPTAILDWIESEASAIRSTKSAAYLTGQQFADHMADEHSRSGSADGAPISSGFTQMDYYTDGGFRPGEFVVIAARSSIGKTSLAVSMARNIVAGGDPTAFISLEMSPAAIGVRLASQATGVPISQIRTGATDANGKNLIAKFLEKLRGSGFLIASPRSATIGDIRALSRVMVRRESARIVFIDYLSLIQSRGDKRVRHEIVQGFSSDLKSLAEELGVPIVVLVQLNRLAEGQRPNLAMLRESGAIEQDADLVLLLHRENRTDEFGDLLIAKNRNGKLGACSVRFDPDRAMYNEISPQVRKAKEGQWEKHRND